MTTSTDTDTLAGLLARLRGQDPLPHPSEVADAIEALAAKDKARIERLEAALAALILNIDAGGATLGAMKDARAALGDGE